ncbi:MAG TPA: hypothetical protein VFV75_12555 [Candidatus Polarisedimenticolaceae bacterium]|nr:hypothetical protein [Candidatus Polarisedimenticolaceae bacterium]
MTAARALTAASLLLVAALVAGCGPASSSGEATAEPEGAKETPADMSAKDKLAAYAPVRLTTDLAALSENDRKMLPLLIEAAQAMDEVFWLQAFGPKDPFLSAIGDADLRRYAEINYGPWDRLDGDKPFVPGYGAKPDAAQFYPADMTKEEFEKAIAGDKKKAEAFKSEYTRIVRKDGALAAVPYHEAWPEQTQRAAAKLREAAALASDKGLKKYLELRARALETSDFRASDRAWLDMKDNVVDVVVGPIETYEDKLFGYKAAHEAYVLVKDQEWSKRLAKYAAMLPELQKGLPVEAAYKKEVPGTDSDLNAYDVVYYAGDCNAGSKTIAINLPNDETIQLEKGTRRLQLKNAMRAKFDTILVPIANLLIAEDQRKNITFDAFFADVMFHEVAHGLGIKKTIDGKRTVRDALKEQAGALEEGKADILGLHMITKLHEKGDLSDVSLEDAYTTFLAGIFRSVRWGASNAHAQANLSRFHFFQREGAFTRDEATGTYRVDMPKMRAAMDKLSAQILKFQGDGDYDGVVRFMDELGKMDPALQADLDRVGKAGIPKDIVFEQGVEVLGLQPAAATK